MAEPPHPRRRLQRIRFRTNRDQDSYWTAALRPSNIRPSKSVRQSDTRHSSTRKKCDKGASVRHMVAQAALRAEPRLKTDPLLSVRNVSVRFGGIVALDGVS